MNKKLNLAVIGCCMRYPGDSFAKELKLAYIAYPYPKEDLGNPY